MNFYSVKTYIRETYLLISTGVSVLISKYRIGIWNDKNCFVMNDRKNQRKNRIYEERNNLGLDADGSSEDFSFNSYLNSDHDRITGNPDGENDLSSANSPAEPSPLMDK